MANSFKTIPKFTSEAEERAFWETHDSTHYVDWSQAKTVILPNFQSSTYPKPLAFPVDDLGQWPDDLSLRREDMYSDSDL